MTLRKIYAYGLIAGLSYREMRHMKPGFIMDMASIRTEYDLRLNMPAAARKLFGG